MRRDNDEQDAADPDYQPQVANGPLDPSTPTVIVGGDDVLLYVNQRMRIPLNLNVKQE